MIATPALVLVHIDAPHLCAGLEIDPSTDRCVRAAPILGWAVGRTADDLRACFARKGWAATILRQQPEHPAEQ